MMLGVEAIRLQHQQTHVKVLFTSVQSIGQRYYKPAKAFYLNHCLLEGI